MPPPPPIPDGFDAGAPSPHPTIPGAEVPTRAGLRTDVGRAAQVVLGLVSAGFAIVVLAAPQLSLTGLAVLLAEAVGLLSLQTMLAGGRLLRLNRSTLRLPRAWWREIRSWGIVAVGGLALVLALFPVLVPALAEKVTVFLLALALVAGGIGRILPAAGEGLPAWLRGSSAATGLFVVALVVLSLQFTGYALSSFALLVGVILLVGGIETIVAGIHPTDPRQFVILKLILFSSFYGLVLINWIDLFGKTVPAYGLWLILTYMAPFGVLIVFEGLESWPLATSLGLLVSLNNDLGYYFVGNLLFGFHVALGPWISGQLGLQGSKVVTVFYGGGFSLDVTSWMMGLSIYVRAAVVVAILYRWWLHPGDIVAKSAPAPAVAPG